MSDTLEDQLDLVLDSHPQRFRQHKAEQAERERTIRDAHAELEHEQEKFFTEVRSLLEQTVGRANRHLAMRTEKCQLREVSGYLTGPLFVGGSACNPIAYELRKDGRVVGETLIVELTYEGMIEAFLGPFRPTVSEGHTTREDLGWSPVALDEFDAKIASELVVRYITAIASRWPLGKEQ
jgi:hypothetical protein